MLAFSFFALIFSSLLWLIFSLRYIMDNLAGISIFSAGLVSIITYASLVCLPIFLMWMVFSYINQYLQNRNTNTQLQKLFIQLKKNQDYSDLMARVLIETEQQIKNGFVLNKFDLLLADMNELLAEIIRLCNIASNEQIEHLWSKVQNGGKWSFGKVIIEINSAQENFQMRIYEKACRDVVLSGTIMEFCARYLAVVNLLEKHDHEKIFLNIIETGVMGKIFSIFAPISDEVRKYRESNANFRNNNKPVEAFKAQESTRPAPMPRKEVIEENKKSLLGGIFKKKESNIGTPSNERDPFSVALERSFGNAEQDEAPKISLSIDEEVFVENPAFENNKEIFLGEGKSEPMFEIAIPEMPMVDYEPELSSTQKTLENLKKEWAEIKTKNEPTLITPTATAQETPTLSVEKTSNEDENFTYPFGGWVDEQNYK